MKTILDTEYGYVKCDIDGDGYNTVRIWEDGDKYGYFRHSNCYRDVEFTGLTKAELLEKIVEDDFLVSTRHGRHRIRRFVRELKRKPEPKPEPKPVSWHDLLDEPLPAVNMESIVTERAEAIMAAYRESAERGVLAVHPGTNPHEGYTGRPDDYRSAGTVAPASFTINVSNIIGTWLA